MKIIKPLTLGILFKAYQQQRQSRLVVTALAFFPLGQDVPARFLPEASQWGRLMPALPAGQALDEAMPKASAEAMVFGRACAPGGTPVTQLAVRMQVGAIDKSLMLADAQPWQYQALPLGPMPIDSAERTCHAGTYDARWLREDYPGLPPDVDWRLYNQAAVDQRLQGFFCGGEPYQLQGMHPDRPSLSGTLPTQRVRAFALAQGAPATALSEIPLVLDSVRLWPELELGVLAYRGQMPVADSDALDIHALMLGYEGADEPSRTLTYYAQALQLRMDPKTAGLHAFNESQLAPALHPTAAEQQADQAAALAALQKKQAVLDELTQTFWQQSGMQKPADYQPPQASLPVLPTPTARQLAAGDMDLTAMMQAVDQLQAQVRADSAAQQAQSQLELAQMQQTVSASASSSPDPAPPLDWAKVLQRANGSEDAATLQWIAQSGAEPRAVQQATAAAKLKQQARYASPTLIAPAQTLPPALAAQLGAQVLAWVAAGVSLAGRDLAGANLQGACLAGLDMRGCLLECADLRQADLRGAQLQGAVLTQAMLDGAVLDSAQLCDANMSQTQASDARMHHANLKGVRAARSDWRGAQGEGADLSSAQFDEADLRRSCFDRAKLDGTLLNQTLLEASHWREARFSKVVAWKAQAGQANFSGSHWSRSALMGADLTQSIWHGARLIQVQCNDADWRTADLQGIRAERCSWTQSHLVDADLRQAYLRNCDMSRADLQGARLDGACLPQTLLMQARMAQVSAVNTDFFQALLRKADLRGADLRDASLYEAEWTEVCWQQADTRGVRLDARRMLP